MPFDPLVTNPGRLSILTALVNTPSQEFVRLRTETQMTDGNLATHARRLQGAGFVEIRKSFRDGKPVTTYLITRQGREALRTHIDSIMTAIASPATPPPTHASTADEWVD